MTPFDLIVWALAVAVAIVIVAAPVVAVLAVLAGIRKAERLGPSLEMDRERGR